MPSRDGGLCRIRLPGGFISPAALHAVADAASCHASGLVEITNRANLQIRGVRKNAETALIHALLAAGLGPRAPGGDDLRNLMFSPSAGVDPRQRLDARPLADALLGCLQATPRFQVLSPKFCLLLDAGEVIAMREHAHDIWFAALPAVPGERLPSPAHVPFAVGLAGCPPSRQAPAVTGRVWGSVRADQLPHLLTALLDTFLTLAAPGQTRMRDVLTTTPPALFMKLVQRRAGILLESLVIPPDSDWHARCSLTSVPLGVWPQAGGPSGIQWGMMPPLGRLTSQQLLALADRLARNANVSVRFTPWQSLLVRDISPDAMLQWQAFARANGFLAEPANPLTRMIACAGSRGCARSLADTLQDARDLAAHPVSEALMAEQRLPQVHLSGCQRRCAAAHAVPFTMIAVDERRYDLFWREHFAAPSLCIGRGLDVGDIAVRLAMPGFSEVMVDD